MWNPKLTLLPVAAAGLIAVQGMSQSAPLPQDPGSGDETKALASQVALLEARVSGLEKYIEKQAKAAEALNGSIDAAVDAGFTAGINFKAREILVKAWKSANKAQMDTDSGSKSKGSSERGGRR